MFDDLDRVVLDDADVGKLLLLDQPEKTPDAGTVNLDCEKIVRGPRFRDRGRRFPHAEANFQDLRARPAENASEVQRGRRKRNAETRKQRLVSAPLRRRKSSLAQHEASN